MSLDDELLIARRLGDALLTRGWRCAVAESCTGGRLAAAMTEVAGSSQWFDRGFITYSNQAKMEMLGVPEGMLNTEGAVSEFTVRAMAEGALAKSQADLTVAISGIAGPTGGSLLKPVGLVWFAWAGHSTVAQAASYVFKGDRNAVRTQAVYVAIEGLIQRCTFEGEQHVR